MASGLSLHEACSIGDGDEIDANILICISQRFSELEGLNASRQENLRHWFTIFVGSMIFFMQAGFAMVCAGCVRKKNLQNTMLKNVLDACFASIAFYLLGYGIAFGADSEYEGLSFVGRGDYLGIYGSDFDFTFWFMQFAFCATCVTIVAGTIAERAQMRAYLCYSVFLTGIVYPVAAHAVWSSHGFLSTGAAHPLYGIGVIDFAGSGVIHVTGGAVALIAAVILGPRVGRFYDSHGRPFRRPRDIPGHSVALQLLGTFVLWFGWYGFNPGSALLLGVENAGAIAARAAATTSMAGAAGALSALLINLYTEYEISGESLFSISMAMNGALSGLVAITAGCGTVELWAGLLIGIIAGALYVGGHHLLLYLQIDDVVDGIPVHLVNGIWGMVATGLFSSPSATLAAYGTDAHVGWFYSLGAGSSDATLLGNQVLALLFLIGWSSCTMIPFFLVLQYFDWLRLDSVKEVVGLDQSYHGAALAEAEEEVLADVKEFDRIARKLNGGTSKSGSSMSRDEHTIKVGSIVKVGKIDEHEAFAI